MNLPRCGELRERFEDLFLTQTRWNHDTKNIKGLQPRYKGRQLFLVRHGRRGSHDDLFNIREWRLAAVGSGERVGRARGHQRIHRGSGVHIGVTVKWTI